MDYKEIIKRIFKIKSEYHISPDSLTDYNINKGVLSELVQLKAEKDKLLLELAKHKQTPKKQEEEEIIKYDLNKKKDEIQEVKKTNYFSLGSFFQQVAKNPKILSKIYITDFDRSTKIDKLKDIGIVGDGSVVVVGKNQGVIWGGTNLKDVFFNVRGLNNDFNSGLIPLCVDTEGNYIENTMEYDIPEYKKFGTKLQYTKARKRPVYEIISEKNKIIQSQNKEIEDLEELTSEYEQENDKLKRDLKVKNTTNQNLISEISERQQSNKNIDQTFQSLIRKLEFSESKNMIVEAELDKLYTIVEKLRDEVEVEGAKTTLVKTLEMVQNIKTNLVNDQPQIKVIETPTRSQNPLDLPKN